MEGRINRTNWITKWKANTRQGMRMRCLCKIYGLYGMKTHNMQNAFCQRNFHVQRESSPREGTIIGILYSFKWLSGYPEAQSHAECRIYMCGFDIDGLLLSGILKFIRVRLDFDGTVKERFEILYLCNMLHHLVNPNKGSCFFAEDVAWKPDWSSLRSALGCAVLVLRLLIGLHWTLLIGLCLLPTPSRVLLSTLRNTEVSLQATFTADAFDPMIWPSEHFFPIRDSLVERFKFSSSRELSNSAARNFKSKGFASNLKILLPASLYAWWSSIRSKLMNLEACRSCAKLSAELKSTRIHRWHRNMCVLEITFFKCLDAHAIRLRSRRSRSLASKFYAPPLDARQIYIPKQASCNHFFTRRSRAWSAKPRTSTQDDSVHNWEFSKRRGRHSLSNFEFQNELFRSCGR